MILVFSTQVLLSCSSDSGKEQPGSTSSVTSSETTNAVDAKEKKPDAIAQGLKGKVEGDV